MRRLTVLFVSVIVLGTFAAAQMAPKPVEIPRTELFLGYAYQHADTTGINAVSGGILAVDSASLKGFAFDFSRYMRNNLGFTVDIARTTTKAVNSTGIKYVRTSYMAGPSYRLRQMGFFNSSVHALAGVDRDDFTDKDTSLEFKNTDFAAAAGVTLDGGLSRHVAVRLAQVDYLYTHHYGNNQSSFRYAGGVLVRF